MLSAAAEDQSQVQRFSVRFGATPTSPIAPPVRCATPTPGRIFCPYQEPDYVPHFESVVPAAIQSCGASFVRFEPLTEGAERAYFDVRADKAAAVVDCIKQRLPQGNMEAAVGPIVRSRT